MSQGLFENKEYKNRQDTVLIGDVAPHYAWPYVVLRTLNVATSGSFCAHARAEQNRFWFDFLIYTAWQIRFCTIELAESTSRTSLSKTGFECIVGLLKRVSFKLLGIGVGSGGRERGRGLNLKDEQVSPEGKDYNNYCTTREILFEQKQTISEPSPNLTVFSGKIRPQSLLLAGYQLMK